jgi:cupin fold WbuC family metalloprotein
MSLALPNVSGEVFVLNNEIIQRGMRAAAESPRLRMILPIHRAQDAPVQRMLNFFQPGTYVRSHMHPLDGAIETISVLRGCLGFVIYDRDGNVKSAHRLEADALPVIDIEPRTWHGMVALEPDTVVLEIKRGPYDAASDKTFASWAPEEGSGDAEGYRLRVEALFSK